MATRNEYFPQSRPYPGKTLFEKMEEMGISSQDFAEYTGKSEKIINDVLNGEGRITSDLAVQFEIVTRIPANFWLNSQKNYDEFMASKIQIKKSNVAIYA